MKRIIRSKEHLIQVNRRSAQRTIGIAAFLIACIGFATPVLLSRAATVATTYDSKAIILVTGDYQLSTSATSIQHSFGTCTSAVGQLFTIQAGTYTMCDAVAFGSPDGVIVYVPTAPAGFYVANWRVTGNSTNGSVSCNTSSCNLNYTAGTANLEVDINATTRPTAPTVSVGGTTANSVAFNWSAGSAGSATFYDYLPYYNGSTGPVTQARSFNWTGLSCGKTVSMKVAIRTSAGNWPSNIASGTTTACTPTSTPNPTPNPTPKPTPGTTPAPTPRPVAATTPRPSTGGSTVTSGGRGAGAPIVTDTQAPTTPSDFVATPDPTNALVDLTWSASTDNTAVIGYILERSIDQATWEPMAANGLNTAFHDDSPKFGLHYYYRLQASDSSGNKSAYATADAAVAGFKSIADDVDMVYSSTDSLAKVLVPSGTFAEPVTCSLETIAGMDGRGTLKHPVIVAGAYQLSCKNQNSDEVAPSLHPITWTLNLKGKLKGLTKPGVVAFDSNDKATEVKEPFIVGKDSVITFKTTSATRVAGAAAHISYAWLQYVAVAVLIMLGIAATAFMVLHRSRKLNYDAYIRSKYYDL